MIISKNPYVKNFIKIAYSNLNHDEISVKKFYNNIDPNFSYQGYFDEEEKEIGISMKKQRWLSMFVHEYAHYLQWKFDNPTYTAYNTLSTDPIILVENYVKNQLSYNNQIKKAFTIIRKNEADCDSIACKLIKKHKLPIDLNLYKKEANLQLVFYHCVEQTKKWNINNFYNSKLMNLMPSKIQHNYAIKIPDKIMSVALEYCKE